MRGERCARNLTLALVLTLVGSLAAAADAARAQDAASTATASTDPAAATGTIAAAGAAALAPLLQAVADAFAADGTAIEIALERSASAAGLARFCAGETDLAASGRRIETEEAAACADNGIAYDGVLLAVDAVVVVVHPDNDFVECLSVDQLRRLWEPDSTVSTWRQLDPAWPADTITLYGTGSGSGTYQSFTQAIIGEEGASRDDYEVTPSPPITAEAVADNPNALGFLPLPRFAETRGRLRSIPIDGGAGCVTLTPATIVGGAYTPLAHRLYLYVNRERLARPEIAAFLRALFARPERFARAAGLTSIKAGVSAANRAKLEAAIAGTEPPDGPPA